jgi:hypothetical protein
LTSALSYEEQANGATIRLALKSIVSGREEAGEDITKAESTIAGK